MGSKGKLNIFEKDIPLPRPTIRRPARRSLSICTDELQRVLDDSLLRYNNTCNFSRDHQRAGSVCVLRILARVNSQQALLAVYSAHVNSHLTYDIVLWGIVLWPYDCSCCRKDLSEVFLLCLTANLCLLF
ncbi:hypothetical protein J6590_005525 [Homalodisca vitripennis]|nr:hypothetical protein J6590_005525 [Homalodisca vitripennis]